MGRETCRSKTVVTSFGSCHGTKKITITLVRERCGFLDENSEPQMMFCKVIILTESQKVPLAMYLFLFLPWIINKNFHYKAIHHYIHISQLFLFDPKYNSDCLFFFFINNRQQSKLLYNKNFKLDLRTVTPRLQFETLQTIHFLLGNCVFQISWFVPDRCHFWIYYKRYV